MSGSESHLYEFGPFRLDTAERCLVRDGCFVPLTPKALELLLVLIRKSGRVVGKDELMKELWPDSFVEEGNLSQHVFVLRKALGENHSEPQFIETVARRGYRFRAVVNQVWQKPTLAPEHSTRAQIVDEEEEAGTKTESSFLDLSNASNSAIGNGRIVKASQSTQPRLASVEYLIGEIRRHGRKAGFALTILILTGVGVYFVWHRFAGQTRLIVKPAAPFEAMKITRLTNAGKASEAAISRDGKYVVHVGEETGKQNLWVRQLATTSDVQIVPPAKVNYLGLTFSNDGNYIYYVVEEQGLTERVLYQVPVLGGVPRKVLVDIRTPITFSPDGKKFAFVRVSPNEEEGVLMIAKADGSGEQKLASRGGVDWFSYSGPAWSPDGRVIASGAGSPRGMTVVTVGVEDGAQREFTSRMWFNVETVAWLADGSGLVLNAADQGTRSKQVWQLSYPAGEARKITNDLNNYHKISFAAESRTLITVEEETFSNIWTTTMAHGADAKQITTSRSDGRYGLSWTPNGRIVYVSDASGNLDIWIADKDGSNQTQLTTDPGQDRRPSVSPDGRYVVFVSDRAGSPNIWRMDIDGNNAKRLTRGIGDVNPYCSSESRWVVFSSYTGTGKQVVFKVPIEGGDPVQLTDKLSPEPSVSPDGTLIACFHLDEKPNSAWRIMVIPFTGEKPVKSFDIPRTANPWKEVRWTADGRALAYIDTRSGVSNIWSQPLAGGPPKRMTTFTTDQLHHFDLSRNGNQLALARGPVVSDVVLITDQKIGTR